MREKSKGENNPNYGKPRTEETRRKIGEAQKGSKNHGARKVKNIEKQETFETIKEASEKYNVTPPAIRRAIIKKGTCKGFHWEYISPERSEE